MDGSTPEIYLGLNEAQKRKQIEQKLNAFGDVDRIFVFHGDTRPSFDFKDVETIYVPWPETEMYRTFYPLLGQPYQGRDIPAITNKSLLVVDEMLMTVKRNDLKYNCTHHFLRVSPRRLIFSAYPFIESNADYMILLDYAWPDRYKMQSYKPAYAKLCTGVPHVPDLGLRTIETTREDVTAYEKKRDSLFENLGQKDPDTIPRALILLAGNIKARYMREDSAYLARNHRIKKDNIFTYSERNTSSVVFILDPTYKRRDFINFMRRNDYPTLIYMKTDLPVDDVYFKDLLDWIDRLEAFYAQSDLRE